jgi:glycosyltransferase involved in cell wall biosynthesis
MTPGVVEEYDGFTLHCLGHVRRLGQMRYVGLAEKLGELRPDVVQSFLAIGWVALDGARLKSRLGYRYYTANHTTASVFPLAQRSSHFWEPARLLNFVSRQAPGRWISRRTERCYAATVDCADVAERFFGVEHEKVEILPLGVDTERFAPAVTAEQRSRRVAVRAELACNDDETVCIYTGQFSAAKNPELLAQAIGILRAQGMKVRGLFFGDGEQAEALRRSDGCIVRGFVPNIELPDFYRASDIGVWPTQESTSMLDATACGLPIVVNDSLKAFERIEGNGLQYKLNDRDDLARVVGRLVSDQALRSKLGVTGAQRMAAQFGWHSLARKRFDDYSSALLAGVSK